MKISETDRVYLRALTIDDAANFYALNSDEEVLKYTGDKPFESLAEAQKFLENYDSYKKDGFGRWAVIRKSDEAFLGWCGLKRTESNQEVDIGFRFFRKYWNQGYASEAALASLKIGFETYELNCVVGRSMKDNTASIHVLEKIGLTFDSYMNFEGDQGVKYCIRKNDVRNG